MKLTLLHMLLLFLGEVTGQLNKHAEKAKFIRDIVDETKYNKHEMKGPVKLWLGVKYHKLIDLNERTHQLTSNVWIIMEWNDDRLQWPPSTAYRQLFIRATDIWRPDLHVDAIQISEPSPHGVALVLPTGRVSYTYSVIVRTYCPLNARFFPIDRQTCNISIGPWFYATTAVELNSLTKDGTLLAGHYTPHPVWGLLGITVSIRKRYLRDINSINVYDFIYLINLKRNSGRTVLLVVLPLVFINLITVTQFLLPCNSGEKVTLGIVMFLAMIIHESFFAYLSPNSEHVPLFMSYMTASLVLVGLSLFNTFLLLSAFHGGHVGTNPRLVGWARSAILVGLSRVVCLRSHTKLFMRQAPPWNEAGVPEPDNDQLSEVVGSKSKMREPLEEQVALGKSHEEVSDFELDIGVELAKKKKKHKKKKKKKPAQAIQMLERHLQTFMLNSFNQTEKEHNMDEWKQVAMVIGRALLIIYGVITICMWIILTNYIVSRP